MDFLSDKVKKMTPHVGVAPLKENGWIKLNENESPYAPSPKVREALDNADIEKFRLYPDKYSTELVDAIAQVNNCKRENVFTGHSSSEILAMSMQVFFNGKQNIQMPDVSYYYYPIWSEVSNIKPNYKPVKSDYSINARDYENANGVLICNPNAPTSLALDSEKIEHIVKNNKNGVVIVDEAYIDYAKVKSCAGLINKYKNLLVVRTFSKSHSLAGLRIGYALGDKGLIENIWALRHAFISYAPNLLSTVAATAAIKDTDYFNETREKVIATRDDTKDKLRKIGFEVLDSQTNFLFAKPDGGDAKGVFEKLKSNKFLVRHWDKPRLNEHLRISIGTPQEMEKLAGVLKHDIGNN
jgi:histidinol-phosphate aminotransferase